MQALFWTVFIAVIVAFCHWTYCGVVDHIKVIQMSEKVSRIVDLSKMGKVLLAGPTLGKEVASKADLVKVVKLEIIANEKMLITSSFFVALLSKVNVKESQITYKGFSNQTQCELKRALKRL